MTHVAPGFGPARRAPNGRALAVAGLLAAAAACSKPHVTQPAPTLEQRMLTAADLLLECMSSAGLDCVPHNAGTDAWSAHGDLELIAKVPAAVLPKYLSLAAAELPRVTYVQQRAVEQSVGAVRLARGLTCKARRAEYVGCFFAARRGVLDEQARALGLPRTAVAEDLAVLLRAAAFLDKAWLVEARCAGGDLYVLVAPVHALAPDDDPAAYPAGGWQAIVAATAHDTILRGFPSPVPRPGPRIDDEAPEEAVDPWLPVTRLDL